MTTSPDKGFQPPDYSIVTKAGLDGTMFYPRRDWSPPPQGAEDLAVPVADGVNVGCRLYVLSPEAPTILYFHGNGEVATADYDDISTLYTDMGVNLFVADFRGYGVSDGQPTFAAMIEDAHAIFEFFGDLLAAQQFTGPHYLMGRSLGAHSVVELAAHYPDALAGLIVESGASSMGRMVDRLAEVGLAAEGAELEARHLEKIRAIQLPTLVIHGEEDELIPVSRAHDFYGALTVTDKRLVTIPQAGHNDLLWVGVQPYFAAIRELIFGDQETRTPG